MLDATGRSASQVAERLGTMECGEVRHLGPADSRIRFHMYAPTAISGSVVSPTRPGARRETSLGPIDREPAAPPAMRAGGDKRPTTC
jgi:hypothetical protein